MNTFLAEPIYEYLEAPLKKNLCFSTNSNIQNYSNTWVKINNASFNLFVLTAICIHSTYYVSD